MADAECSGYSGGSVVAAVVGTFVATLVVLALIYLVWKWLKKRQAKRSGLHNLVIVDDGSGLGGDSKAFSYDNPGFMDDSVGSKKSEQGRGLDAKFGGTSKPDVQQNGSKSKNPWSNLSFLFKSRNALDDSAVEEPQKYNVALRGHDFTGLGFNICGNMRDGIFVKDIMQRGPAAESKQILPGDQITGMTVSFKQMVVEDAITLLSYASPYEVNLEMLRLPEKSLPHKGIFMSSPSASSGQSNSMDRVCHPFFKSQSIDDLRKVGKEHLDLQVDRKNNQVNGVHGKVASANDSMEIPTVVVIGNNETRSPSKVTPTKKMPKLPKMNFSLGGSSPKTPKIPEPQPKPSSSSVEIAVDTVDGVNKGGASVSVKKPEIIPRSKVKTTHVQKSFPEEVELVEAISPAIDKMTAEFDTSMKKLDKSIEKPGGSMAVLDVQPVEIDMSGQPTVIVETGSEVHKAEAQLPSASLKMEVPSVQVDARSPSMIQMPFGKDKGSKEKKKEEKKKEEKKEEKKKDEKKKDKDSKVVPDKTKGKLKIEVPGISIAPPTLEAEIKRGESENEDSSAAKKPPRDPKTKDKKSSKPKEETEEKGETPGKEKKSFDQSDSTATGEKSKFFKFGMPDISLNFGFGGHKSSAEDKKSKDSEAKDLKDSNEGEKDKESAIVIQQKVPTLNVEVPKAEVDVPKDIVEADVKLAASIPEPKLTVEKTTSKAKSPKGKGEGIDKEEKEPAVTKQSEKEIQEQEPQAQHQPAAQSQKEKSGFSFNIKLPSFDKPLLKRKDSSGSSSGQVGVESNISVDSHPDASSAPIVKTAELKSKSDKENEPSPKKTKKTKKEKASSRPTSPEMSEGQRTTDDEFERNADVVDSVPGEKLSKKGSGFHLPHIGIKLPKFGSTKQTYSFENPADNKDLKHSHGPTAEALLEPSSSTNMDTSANMAEFRKMTPTADMPEVTVTMDSTSTKAKDKEVVELSMPSIKTEAATLKETLPSASVSVDVPSISSGKLEKGDDTIVELGAVPTITTEEKVELMEVKANLSSEGMSMPKKETEDKDDKGSPKEKESKPSLVSKGLKGLRDLKDKVTHKLSHDHTQQASGSSSDEERGPAADNDQDKEKAKKEKKMKEKDARALSKEEKAREKAEKAKEKERLKAERKLKKAELKKKLSSAQSSSSSSSSSSSDESDAEDGVAGAEKKKKKSKTTKRNKDKKQRGKKEKKDDKKSMEPVGIQVKAEIPSMVEVQSPEIVASTAIEQKQIVGHEAKLIPAKPPVVPTKSKDSVKEEGSGGKKEGVTTEGQSVHTAVSGKVALRKSKSKGDASTSTNSSSSEGDDSDSAKKDGQESKPKKPTRTTKRKAPQVPYPLSPVGVVLPGDVPDIVKITTSAQVSSPPKEDVKATPGADERQTYGDMRESTPTKTPESGRRSASFEDLSTLQTKLKSGESPLERAVSVDMAGDKEKSAEPGAMPVGSSQEDLSTVPDSKAITHLKLTHGVRVAPTSSSSSSETLKESLVPTFSVHSSMDKKQDKEGSQSSSTVLSGTISENAIAPSSQAQDPQSSTIQQMMSETLCVMNNIVHEMDSPSLVKAAMSSQSVKVVADEPTTQVSVHTSSGGPLITPVDKSDAEKAARETVDEIMMEARERITSDDIPFQINTQSEAEEPRVSVTTSNAITQEFSSSNVLHSLSEDVAGGADSFSIASVKIQASDGVSSGEPVSVRNITVTNIKNEDVSPVQAVVATTATSPAPADDEAVGITESDVTASVKSVQLLREESKARLLQTVADANDIKEAQSTSLLIDSSLTPSTSVQLDSAIKPVFAISSSPVNASGQEDNPNAQTIEITREELDGIMMSHADFLQKQAVAAASASSLLEDSLEVTEQDAEDPHHQQLKDVFDNWVYVEQKNAAHEHTCPHSHSDPEPSTASSNDDDEGPYSRNGALSPTTYTMETEYKFETSEMRVTSSPIPPEEAHVKSQSTVYSTTMTLPQKTVTQITLGDPVQDAGGRIVSKITLDTSSQSAEETNKGTPAASDVVELPKLESLK